MGWGKKLARVCANKRIGTLDKILKITGSIYMCCINTTVRYKSGTMKLLNSIFFYIF